MQVDFYHLTRDPAEQLLPVLAQKTLDGGQRMLIVTGQEAQAVKISKSLWTQDKTSFLAHDFAGCNHEHAQPILISDVVAPANGAQFVALADGEWRDEATSFDRAFYLFAPDAVENARAAWRKLGDDENITRRYWKQDGGKWVEGP